MSMPALDDIMHIHLIAFRSQFLDEVTVSREMDGYYYVGPETKFFEHDMGCHPDWERKVTDVAGAMKLRATMNGQAYSKVYSIKINVDEENMRNTLQSAPLIVEDWCKKYGQQLG